MNSAIIPSTRDYFDRDLVDQYIRVGGALAESCLYPVHSNGDPRAQAYAKIARGVELGIGPSVAMSEIHIVKGKLSLSGALMASLIRRSPNYDYREISCTPDGSEIEFLRDGEILGRTTFTMDDARRADLAGKDNWKKYPEQMCWWRAMSKGANRHCPDVFGGAIYVHGEVPEPERAAIPISSSSVVRGGAPSPKTATDALDDELSLALAQDDSDAAGDTPTDTSDTDSGGEADTDTGGRDSTNSQASTPPSVTVEPDSPAGHVLSVCEKRKLGTPDPETLAAIAELYARRDFTKPGFSKWVSGVLSDCEETEGPTVHRAMLATLQKRQALEDAKAAKLAAAKSNEGSE